MPISPVQRCTTLLVRPAVPSDRADIQKIWSKYGEGNVDIRDQSAVDAAIESSGLHVFEEERAGIVATAGYFPYHQGQFAELGGSCWHPDFRSLGGADISVAFRAMLAVLYEPGTLPVSELYYTSRKSAAVLTRSGWVRLVVIPRVMHEHAYAANAIDPVHHYALPPAALPAAARQLLRAIEGVPVKRRNSELTINFSCNYGFDNCAMLAAIERVSLGDLRVVGHDPIGPEELEKWLCARVPPAMSEVEFLAAVAQPVQTKPPASYLQMDGRH